MSAHPLADIRALDCYLRAMQQVRTFSGAGLDEALALTNRALEVVGDRALLHATQALIHWQYLNAAVKPTWDTLLTADACADRALQLDGELSAGFLAKGLVAFTRGHLPDAAGHLRRAAELDGNSDALSFLSYLSALADRPEAARAYADEAIASDPLNPWTLWSRAMCELVSGDIAVAVDRCRIAETQAPGDPLVMTFHAIMLAVAGHIEEAVPRMERIAERLPHLRPYTQVWSGALKADRVAVCAAARDLGAYAQKDKETSWHLADCLAAVGETDQALRWLANAVDLGFINHRFLSTRDPFLAPLRGDPRFEALMDKAREKQRALAAALA